MCARSGFHHVTPLVLDRLHQHGYKHKKVYVYMQHRTYCRMPEMFVAVYVSARVNGFVGLRARPAGVWRGAFLTSGSGNVDIRFPGQSEDYLRSEKGGGLQYILTLNWGKEAEQSHRRKEERTFRKATFLHSEINSKAP